jgi:competence protein ComEC
VQHARLYSFVGGVVAGAYFSSLITHTWYSTVFLCLGFVIAGIVSSIIVRFRKFIFIKNSVLAALFAVCFSGMLLGAARTALWMSFNHGGVLDDLVNKKVALSAVVTEEPQMSDSSSKIIAETLNDASSTPRAKILITADRYSTVAYGDEIKLYGKVMIPKPIQSDEGDFAYDVYLARQGIFYTMTFPGVSIVSRHHGNIVREYLIDIKNNFLGKINELFSEPRGGLLAGLLVSGRSSLSKAEQTLFTRAGLIHIVALSGFNVTIIAQGLMALLIFLPKRLRLVIGALGIIAFVTMTGFGSTIVRAGIMALLVIAAALVYRTYNVGRALFIAVLCMVLWNPMVVFDVSFQLSCVATFAVIFAAPPVISKYGPRIKFLPEKFQIRDIMLGTAVIEIFLLPILLSTAGQISLVTVITNLLILPTLPIVMGFGFAATLVGYVHGMLALPLVAISNLMLEYILIITNFFANIPFGVIAFQIPWWAVATIYAALAFWLYRLQKFQMQKTKNGTQPDMAPSSQALGTALTSTNLERLDNFFRSHSNSDSQKKP